MTDLSQRLAGRVAVVTGAGGGIGLAAARRMRSEGARIVVGDLDPSTGAAVADELDGLFVGVDVSDQAQVDVLFDTAAQTFGMGTEVLWSDYVLDVIDALPEKAKLTSFVNMTVSPIESAPLPADQLLEVGIGTVTLAHRSPTVPDITEWLEALSQVEGFTDPHASVAQIAEDDGDVYYEVTTTVQVLPEALSGRYLEEGNKQ